MKRLIEYIIETKKTFDFKIKIAGELSNANEQMLKIVLEKYKVLSFEKKGKTPIQQFPLDFPKLQNEEVHIFEVSLDYPIAAHELANYIGNCLRINLQNIVVRTPNDPLDEYQEPVEKREGALLNDSEYKEVPKIDIKDYFGHEYNENMLKELNKKLKEKRAERGEKIPGDDVVGETLNDVKQGTNSPIGSVKLKDKK